MSSDPPRLQDLFLRLVELPPAERPALLAQECGADLDMRQRVEALLKAHAESDRELNGPAHDLPVTRDSDAAAAAFSITGHFISDLEGTRDSRPPLTATTGDGRVATAGAVIAGRYTLLEQIGEGGMGEVWVAKQTEPVQRKVALKLIKTGMDSKAVLQRFEQERQALAMMDHPHIARVLDGGMTPSGQPFFAMELVNGLPLNKFCDTARLSPKERLELFVPICQAVQHAHQKGIVHRDLKPANILVATIDGKPVPKVIDFGVAKAIAGKLTAETLSTQFGAVVGTLEYMSPEQAGFSNADIDTRADIYSLGVILYELLTGLRPIDAQRLKQVALNEMIRIIQEEEPSKPSTRLSTAESLPSLASQRQMEPRKLMALLRGELDWVVMKCLEKHRDRRYETANGLARDIQRYLADEPVEARPPSTSYRLRKFLRRNQGPVLAAGLVLLALVLGIIGTTWGFLAAREQARVAVAAAEAQEEARRNEAEQRTIAQENERTAVARLGQLEKTTESLVGVFRNLNPHSEEQEGLPLRAILARNLNDTAQALQDVAAGDRLSVARMQSWLGSAIDGVGDPAAAIAVFERSLATYRELAGPDDPATLSVANELALAYRASGRTDQALPLLIEILERSRATRGPDHIETLGCMNNLAAAYRSAGQTAKAFPLYVETEAKTRATLGPNHQATLAATNDLALAHLDLGHLDKALPLFTDTLAKARETLGADHLFTLNTANNLADAYDQAGQPERAMPLQIEALAGRRAKLGPNHPDTLQSMNDVAMAYVAAQQPDQALPLLEEALAGRQARLGPDHPRTLATMTNLAQAYGLVGQTERAQAMLTDALARSEAKLGQDHPETLGIMNNLAEFYWSHKQFDKSVPLFERLLPLHVNKHGPEHPLTLIVLANLGVNYRDSGRLPEAVATLEDAVRRIDRLPPLRAARLGGVRSALTATYEAAGQHDKAAAAYRESWEAARQKFGDNHINSAAAAVLWAINLLKQSKFAEAEPVLVQALATRERAAPDDWSTFNTKSALGASLLGQQKYAAAEPLLLAGYEGMKQRESTIPVTGKIRLTEALERLIQFYEATDKPDEVTRWRTELATRQADGAQPENAEPGPR